MFRRAGVLLLGLTAALYLYDLGRAPVYLGLDEAHFGVHALALAQSGRNLNGDVLPLFINLADPLGDQPALPWGNSWYHPLLFYLIALALKVLPFTEASVRTPTALIAGAVNVALMYGVAMRLFQSRWLAVTAALMLALTPAHVILGRQALDYVCPLPFILGWLWCLLIFVQTSRAGFAFAGGLLLGVGCYSYVSSWMIMPACLALSWFVYGASRRPSMAATVGFALPLVLLLPWLWWHPQMVNNLLDAQSMSAVEAYGRGLGLSRVTQSTVAIYWSYFNPAFLFLTGGPSLNATTGQAGVFLLPIAIFLPVGIGTLLRGGDPIGVRGGNPVGVRGGNPSGLPGHRGMSTIKWVLLLGFLLAPIPATLKGMPHVPQRVLVMLPFAILISVFGLSALWRSQHRLVRLVAAFLLVAMPLQFARFYVDYLADYRLRSAAAYDRTAFRETADALVAADSTSVVPAFYLTAPLYDVSAKWRFYATKYGREPLLQRTRYFDGNVAALADVPPGSLVVIEVDDAKIDALVRTGAWSLDRRMTDVAGRAALAILRKT